MSFLNAFLAKDANLVGDTGTERVDITPRGYGDGWDMVLPNDEFGEMAPFTHNAVYRVPSAADWGIGVSGLYHGAEMLKIDAVKSSRNLVVFGLQADRDIGATGATYYGLGGNVVFNGFTRALGDRMVLLNGLTFNQVGPMTYLTDWVNSVSWSPDDPPVGTEDNSEEYIEWDWANGPPVVLYDISAITVGSGPVLKVTLVDGANRYETDIPTARARVGIIDFNTLDPDATYTGTVSAWPTTGTMQMHIRAAGMSALDIRFGAGTLLTQRS